MNWFGKKTQARAAPQQTPAETIMKLRQTLETMEKRETHIQKKIDQQLAEAKKRSARKDKRGALFCLKRKKMYENEIAKLQGARMTLESQIMSLEGAATNMEVFGAMKQGTSAIKAVHRDMDVDQVADTMDEIQEGMDLANEVSDAISQPIGDAGLEDEDDLMAELDAWEEEEMEAKLLDVPAVPTGGQAAATAEPTVALPSVPTGPVAHAAAPAAVEEDEDAAALRALEAEMAL